MFILEIIYSLTYLFKDLKDLNNNKKDRLAEKIKGRKEGKRIIILTVDMVLIC